MVDEPVVQSGITATWESGFYADFWVSKNFAESFRDGSGSEIDYSIGWAGPCGEFVCHVKAAFFDVPSLGQIDGDIVQLTIELKDSYTIEGGSVGWYTKVQDLSYINTDGRETQLLIGGLNGSFDLGENWKLKGLVGYSWNTSAERSTASYEFGVSVNLGEGWTLSPLFVNGFIPFEDGRDSANVVSTRFTKSFE